MSEKNWTYSIKYQLGQKGEKTKQNKTITSTTTTTTNITSSSTNKKEEEEEGRKKTKKKKQPWDGLSATGL